jgi:hypothetical protein
MGTRLEVDDSEHGPAASAPPRTGTSGVPVGDPVADDQDPRSRTAYLVKITTDRLLAAALLILRKTLRLAASGYRRPLTIRPTRSS